MLASDFPAEAFFMGAWFYQARTTSAVHAKSATFHQENSKRVKIVSTGVPPAVLTGRPFHTDRASYNVFAACVPVGVYNVLHASNVGGPAGVAIVAGRTFDSVCVLTRAESPAVPVVSALKAQAEAIHPGISWA